MNNWILLTILYAIFIAFYESCKKKAIIKSSIYDVLALFSTISFLLVVFITKDAFTIDYTYLLMILIKALIIIVAWILGLKAIENMQLSIYGIVKISRIVFSVLLSCLFLNENVTFEISIGICIIVFGLILVNKTTDQGNNKQNKLKVIVLLLISCFLNSVSAILDKKILLHITSNQLQFWFLLFLMIGYWILLIVKQRKININQITKNYWIPIASIFFVFGDRFLFKANENINSKVIIMTLLKQVSVIMTILLGKIMFNEKEIFKKLLYSLLIIFGILIIIIF